MDFLMKNYFSIFGFHVYYYAIMIVTGMLVGSFLTALLLKRRGYQPDNILDMMIVILPLAIIGARIYYVIFKWDDYDTFWEMLNIRNGGLAIYGGIIGGAIGVFIISKWKKIPFICLADILMPGLLIGQAIGRWGNFFNQEAHGDVVTNPAHFGLPWSVNIGGTYYRATFFYESIWCLLGCILLFIFAWKYRNRANGLVFMFYLIWYGAERMIVEGMRTDSLYLWGTGIRVSQALSALMILAGIVGTVVIVLRYRKKLKEETPPLLSGAAETEDEKPSEDKTKK